MFIRKICCDLDSVVKESFVKIIKYILLGLFSFSCNSNSAETFWEKANQYRTEENLKESIINLKFFFAFQIV